MSHFTVLVIGDDVEDQLAPYDEGLETEPTCQGDVSQEDINRFVNHYKEKGISYPTLKDLYDDKGEDWNNGTWRFDGDTVTEWSTYNPDSKWDWYEIGGRWSGFFKPKTSDSKSDYVDSILKGDLDITSMRDISGNEAGKLWDSVNDAIGHLPQSETWKSVIDRLKDRDIAREFYHDQPRNKAVASHKKLRGIFGWGTSVEDFDVSREEYVTNARNNALSTFAVLKDGEWIEKGDMGWFGIVTDEMDQNEWDLKFNQMLDELPDDTLLTLIDCHI
jgi:hypothetical protein